MPPKQKKTARRKAGVYRKKRWGRRRPTVNVNRALQPLAQRFICKQKYSDVFAISVGTPTYTFNLNSVFDPNRTGVGHQPYGFDNLAAIYNRYRVIGCTWNIQMWNSSTAVRTAVIPLNDLPTFTSISEICENPRAKWKTFIPGGSPVLIRGYTSIPSLTGRTKAQYMADDRYQSPVTGSPQELALLHIACANLADSTIDGTLFNITLEYTVEYFDIKNVAQS